MLIFCYFEGIIHKDWFPLVHKIEKYFNKAVSLQKCNIYILVLKVELANKIAIELNMSRIVLVTILEVL